MDCINIKFSRAMAIIVSILTITGLVFIPAVTAAERSLVITDLRLIPATIPVNQPFEFKISFQLTDFESSRTSMDAFLSFRILKNNKTLFTSTSYPIDTASGEVKVWVTRMNPVPAKGHYTLSAHVSHEELNARKSIDLAIGIPPEERPPAIAERDRVHVRHILVKTQADAYELLSGMSGLSDNDLREKFISEAKSNSVGPTGKNGGDLGMIKRGMMVLEFETAAFNLPPGTMTRRPVKTVYGYHIIYREK